MLLVATDPHFNDNPEEAYRYKLLPWLAEQAKKFSVDAVLILGDLTDAKDKHSAKLVHKVANGILNIAKVAPVHVLKGNHDYLDPMYPFFKFLDHLPNINYYDEPTIVRLPNGASSINVAMLPHAPDPYEAWKHMERDIVNANVVFMHQTVEGAKAESGQELKGLSASYFGNMLVYSGDVHVPQGVGCVEYIGTPYRIRFGDTFRGRCVLLHPWAGHSENIYFPCPNKHLLTVRSAREIITNKELQEGDHVKVRIVLGRSEFTDWDKRKRNVRKACAERGLKLRMVELVEDKDRRSVAGLGKVALVQEPLTVYDSYVKARKLDEYISKVGRRVVEEKV